VTSILLVASIIIFVGFLSNFLFRRYRAPDVLILILLGYLIGPGGFGIIEDDLEGIVFSLTPLVAAIALSIIMFHGGMLLKVDEILTSFKNAMVHSLLGFVLSGLVVTVITMAIMGWEITESLFMGFILAGTSAAVVIPLVCNLKVRQSTRTILVLESALTDVLMIGLATSLLIIVASDSPNLLDGVVILAKDFFIALLVGISAGYLWLKVLRKLSGQPFAYMITLATMLGVFAITELFVDNAGGGAIAVLIFGLIIVNSGELAHMLGRPEKGIVLDNKIIEFNEEVTFFVRTFFFVFLGIIISLLEIHILYILTGVAIFLGLIGVRYLIVSSLSNLENQREDVHALFFMMPRGLTSAVLAALPLSIGGLSSEISDMVIGIATIVILLTTAFASLGAYIIGRTEKIGADPQEQPFLPG
jgi:potassium/hydrogen antiporter